MAGDQPKKHLLRVEYDCDVGFGPADEWIIFEGVTVPQVGDRGYGRNCYSHVSLQACDDVDCNPHGGVLSAVEPYSSERVRELALEDDVIEREPARVEGRVWLKRK
jgi:hypothetical protein